MSYEKSLIAIVVAGAVVAVGLFGYGVVGQESAVLTFLNPSTARPKLPAPAATSTLLFAGDVMLSRGVAYMAERYGEKSPHYPFEEIRKTLRDADLTIGNLEGPISSRGENRGSQYSFRAEPKMADGLAFAGFDVLALANNHIWDWGTEALVDTPRLLAEKGIASVGAGATAQQANVPYITKVNGTTFAFVSYTNLYPASLVAGTSTPGISNPDVETVTRTVRALHRQADVVTVLWHWGEEYAREPRQEQRQIAHNLIDAGADLIVGTHSHVVQEPERYKDGWIAYSLGNFIFDQGFSAETMRGALLKVEVVDGIVDTVAPVPISLTSRFQPFVGGQTGPFLQTLPFKNITPAVTLSEGFTAYDGALQDIPGALHRGIDYVRRAQGGAFLRFGVYAMHDGETLQGESETWGNYVLVRTSSGTLRPYTIYGHLENIPSFIPRIVPSVLGSQQGARISAGTYLGEAGITGNTKGIPQLHIELHEEDREAGTARKLDPYNVYDRASSGRYPQPSQEITAQRHYWTTNAPPFAQ